MGLNHCEPAYTDKARPLIEEYGGKLGGLEFIRAYAPGLRERILPMIAIPDGKELDGDPPWRESRSIIRTSHPHDFQGLVDVLPTSVFKPSESDDYSLRDCINHIRKEAARRAIIDYARYENPNYDGKVTVGIQPYMPGYNGSIVEHPNNPGTYLVSFCLGRKEQHKITARVVVYNEQTDQIEKSIYAGVSCSEDLAAWARNLAFAYRTVRYSGFTRDDVAYQLEYVEGEDNFPYIAQVRAFMKKQEAHFDVPEGIPGVIFGITPEEGIELPVINSPDGYDSQNRPIQSPDTPWAFLKTDHQHSSPLSFQPRRLTAYLPVQSFATGRTESLEHNHFRLAQKSDVTIFEHSYGDGGHDFTNILFSGNVFPRGVAFNALRSCAGILPIKVRIVSNGRESLVTPCIK